MERSTTRVYRAVSAEEYRQILATGMLAIVRYGCEGKHFADTVDGARRFGEVLMGVGKYYLIEADVPDEASSLFKWPDLDGLGPARYLHIDDLRQVRARPFEGSES